MDTSSEGVGKSAVLESGLNIIKPQRCLSVGDMHGRSARRLLQGSLSDLTDESSSPKLKESDSEFEFPMNYCEVVTVAGVSDIPEFCTFEDEYDLPTAPYAGYTTPTSARTKLQASVILSLHFPHKLLIVTQGLCDLFRYTVDSEICGRALKTLYGPRTDADAIATAIHNVAVNKATSHPIGLVLYNRDGEGVQVMARFSAFLSDAETLAGCLLELSPVNSWLS
jgi:hypothetical protein